MSRRHVPVFSQRFLSFVPSPAHPSSASSRRQSRRRCRPSSARARPSSWPLLPLACWPWCVRQLPRPAMPHAPPVDLLTPYATSLPCSRFTLCCSASCSSSSPPLRPTAPPPSPRRSAAASRRASSPTGPTQGHQPCSINSIQSNTVYSDQCPAESCPQLPELNAPARAARCPARPWPCWAVGRRGRSWRAPPSSSS